MPGFTATALTAMINVIRSQATHISLHTANPGSTGVNEVSGSGYARWSVTTANFTTASAGAFATNAAHEFLGPGAGTCSYAGLWNGATFLGGALITGDTTFNAEGKFILNSGATFQVA